MKIVSLFVLGALFVAIVSGPAAAQTVADGKFGHMVALQSPHIVCVPIKEVLAEDKKVDPTHDVVMTARATGISFGD